MENLPPYIINAYVAWVQSQPSVLLKWQKQGTYINSLYVMQGSEELPVGTQVLSEKFSPVGCLPRVIVNDSTWNKFCLASLVEYKGEDLADFLHFAQSDSTYSSTDNCIYLYKSGVKIGYIDKDVYYVLQCINDAYLDHLAAEKILKDAFKFTYFVRYDIVCIDDQSKYSVKADNGIFKLREIKDNGSLHEAQKNILTTTDYADGYEVLINSISLLEKPESNGQNE